MSMFERLDEPARDVMRAAHDCASSLGDTAIATQHLLFALVTTNNPAADMLSAAGCDADQLRQAMTLRRGNREARPDHSTLLHGLGIDLEAVREHAEQTFGPQAVNRAVALARPSAPRRPVWSRISCNKPLPGRLCDSPLGGKQIGIIPRVKRLLQRATSQARPGLATPTHLLFALVSGNEPAGELLTAYGVDLEALAAAAGREIRRTPSRRRTG